MIFSTLPGIVTLGFSGFSVIAFSFQKALAVMLRSAHSNCVRQVILGAATLFG
jgi:hypothetical protein